MQPNQPNPSNLRRNIIIVVVAAIIVILLILGFTHPVNKSNSNSHPTGVTNEAPETADRDPNQPVFSGTSDLINYGLTFVQEKGLESEFYAYFKKSGQRIKSVTIDPSSIQNLPYNPAVSTVAAISFKVSYGNTHATARVNYPDPASIELLLYNPSSGARIYDSGMQSFDTSTSGGD